MMIRTNANVGDMNRNLQRKLQDFEDRTADSDLVGSGLKIDGTFPKGLFSRGLEDHGFQDVRDVLALVRCRFQNFVDLFPLDDFDRFV
jgi:hypothetical protein